MRSRRSRAPAAADDASQAVFKSPDETALRLVRTALPASCSALPASAWTGSRPDGGLNAPSLPAATASRYSSVARHVRPDLRAHGYPRARASSGGSLKIRRERRPVGTILVFPFGPLVAGQPQPPRRLETMVQSGKQGAHLARTASAEAVVLLQGLLNDGLDAAHVRERGSLIRARERTPPSEP